MSRLSLNSLSIVIFAGACSLGEPPPPPTDSKTFAATSGWTAILTPTQALQPTELLQGYALIGTYAPPATCTSLFLRGQGIGVAYSYDGSWHDVNFWDGYANSIAVNPGSDWLAVYALYDGAYLEYAFHGCDPAPEVPWDGYQSPQEGGFVDCGREGGVPWKEFVVGGVILHDPEKPEAGVRLKVQDGYENANAVWSQCCIEIKQASPAPASATYFGPTLTAGLIGTDYLLEGTGGGMTADEQRVAAVRQTAFQTLTSNEIMAFWASFYINNSTKFIQGYVLARGDTPSVVVGNWVDGYTLGHEIGHQAIGPGHHGSTANLMYEDVGGVELTARQCDIAYNSRFAQ